MPIQISRQLEQKLTEMAWQSLAKNPMSWTYLYWTSGEPTAMGRTRPPKPSPPPPTPSPTPTEPTEPTDQILATEQLRALNHRKAAWRKEMRFYTMVTVKDDCDGYEHLRWAD